MSQKKGASYSFCDFIFVLVPSENRFICIYSTLCFAIAERIYSIE